LGNLRPHIALHAAKAARLFLSDSGEALQSAPLLAILNFDTASCYLELC
jgi:hypothetical protein